MSHKDQELGTAGILPAPDIIFGAARLVEEALRLADPKIIHGRFQRKISPKVRACSQSVPGAPSPSAIIHHTMLSSLRGEDGLNLVDSTWPAGTHVGTHIHHCEDELCIVLAGTLEIRIGERTFLCSTGETAFVPRGTEHEVHAVTEARHIAILSRKCLERPRTV